MKEICRYPVEVVRRESTYSDTHTVIVFTQEATWCPGLGFFCVFWVEVKKYPIKVSVMCLEGFVPECVGVVPLYSCLVLFRIVKSEFSCL